MYFDGSSSREGSSARIVLVSPSKKIIYLSYKLEFETTNNIVDYQKLILELRDAKDLKI